MAVAAETISKVEPSINSQEYGRSVRTLWELGHVAVDATVTPEYAEATVELARADFVTAVTEMLKTDTEFRGLLDIDNSRPHQVIQGKVRAKNGRPMVDIVKDGAEESKKLASTQPVFKAQAIRDEQDVINAERVDALKPGTSLIALSMDPKRALVEHKETYTKLGYIKGLAYLQCYSRIDEDTLVAGSYSIDLSDEKVWRELFAEIGIMVPADESPDRWLQHALEIQATAEETKAFVLSLRERYYKKVGSAHKRSSVTEYVQAHKPFLDQFFDSYYPALGEAVYSGDNNETLKNLAHAMLNQQIGRLDPGVRRQLIKVANSEKFNDNESYKLFDSILRYAAVEQLRKGLAKAKSERPASSKIQPLLADVVVPQTYPIHPAQMHQLVAGNVRLGVEAGRSYGGCPGQIQFSRADRLGSLSDLELQRHSQEAFGGKDEETDQEEASNEECEYEGTFCYCCPYNDDGLPLIKPMVVTIKRFSDGVAKCLRGGCDAALDSNGKLVNPSKIYERAMQLVEQNKTIVH